jgi:hypothetical protein
MYYTNAFLLGTDFLTDILAGRRALRSANCMRISGRESRNIFTVSIELQVGDVLLYTGFFSLRCSKTTRFKRVLSLFI